MFGPIYKAMAQVGIASRDVDQMELWEIAYDLGAGEPETEEQMKERKEKEGLERTRRLLAEREGMLVARGEEVEDRRPSIDPSMFFGGLE